jgi:hypothetical protein
MRLAVLTVLLSLGLATAAPAKTLVRYTRSGGIAGEQTALKVNRDGAAKLTRRADTPSSFTLTATQLRKLKRALRDAGFATLDADYGPRDGVVADGITETVTYAGRTVSASTGGSPPARLERVLVRLRKLTYQ